MANFYKITDQIKAAINATNRVNTITFGNLADIDLNKQNIYPIAHITPENCTMNGATSTWSYNVSIFDLVDFNKDDVRSSPDSFHGIDNVQDILNDCALTFHLWLDQFRRGARHEDNLQLDGGVTLQSFLETQTNSLAGWSASISITAPNATTTDGIC
jgi:hypothetical protein